MLELKVRGSLYRYQQSFKKNTKVHKEITERRESRTVTRREERK